MAAGTRVVAVEEMQGTTSRVCLALLSLGPHQTCRQRVLRKPEGQGSWSMLRGSAGLLFGKAHLPTILQQLGMSSVPPSSCLVPLWGTVSLRCAP